MNAIALPRLRLAGQKSTTKVCTHEPISDSFHEPERRAPARRVDRKHVCAELGLGAPTRFMVPMRVKSLEVEAFQEPALLRVTDPRSGPRVCDPQRLLVPMRVQKNVAPTLGPAW